MLMEQILTLKDDWIFGVNSLAGSKAHNMHILYLQ